MDDQDEWICTVKFKDSEAEGKGKTKKVAKHNAAGTSYVTFYFKKESYFIQNNFSI